MKHFFIFLLFITTLLSAETKTQDYSLRLAYGTASDNDLGQIVFGDFGSHPRDLSVLALDGGYLLKEGAFDWPLDFYVKGGLSYFNEDLHSDVYEANVYIKAYWNFDFWENRIRLGLGEGVSYTSDVLEAEYLEADSGNDNTSKFLNYIDISLDFDLGRLVKYEPLHDTYIGYALKHRSGIFGLINNVEKGGSNYNTFYLEKKF